MNINSTTIGQKPEARASGASANQSNRDAFTSARENLLTEFKQAFGAWKRALYTQRQVIGLSLFDSAYKALLLTAAVIAFLALSLVATLLFVSSVRRGMQLWTAGAWWSDLALAALLILMLAGAAHAVRRMVHRSTLAKTRQTLDEMADLGIGASKETF